MIVANYLLHLALFEMLLSILKKLAGAYTKLRHRHVPILYRYYCRDTYYCKITQLKYILKDYLFKKGKYKEISFQGEFAPELQFVLPFAYWHYKNGTLKKTTSSKYTRELYFFSEDHEELFDIRSNEGNYNYEIPRVLYSHDYDITKWLPVPLKEKYQNNIYVWEKPILIIANRYNMEWGQAPISYFSIPMLDFMIKTLKSRYTIVYNRPRPKNITMDNSDVYELNEYDWIRDTHPEVVLMEDLYDKNEAKARNFNHFQLMVYANAERFLSIHGGTCTLASYFGGENIIYSKQGPEHYFKCFDRLYPKFSGAIIYHARTEEEVKELITQHYLK